MDKISFRQNIHPSLNFSLIHISYQTDLRKVGGNLCLNKLGFLVGSLRE